MADSHGDQYAADHIMRTGEGTCPTHLPLPPGKFNAGMPQDASYWCKRCIRGAACLDAELVQGQTRSCSRATGREQ
jgi:hypothetical protein